jgi:hypothetical protein
MGTRLTVFRERRSMSDSVIAPISFGWHFARADATTGYTIFMPTGRYTDGARDNTGLGMWGHELAVGTPCN